MTRPTQTHYSILAKDGAGELAKLTELLIKEEVSIGGIMMTSIGGKTSIEFLARDRSDLLDKLKLSGLKPRESRAFHRKASRRSKEFHHLVKALGKSGIHILSLYGTAAGKKGRMILEVDGQDKAMGAVAKIGFTPIR